MEKDFLRDVQKNQPVISKAIDKVGICDLPVPLKVRYHGIVEAQGEVSLYTNLAENLKGTHMSRLVQTCLKAVQSDFCDFLIVEDCLWALKEVLEADDSYVRFQFPLLVKREAPVSRERGFIKIDCELEGELLGGEKRLYFKAKLPYLSLCPCSKSISEQGAAHNQRSFASIRMEIDSEWVSSSGGGLDHLLDYLFDVVSIASSSDIFPVMKRVDEKAVVDLAYSNPAFVEDVARSITSEIEKLQRDGVLSMVENFVVVVLHEESIHQHNAVAVIRRGLL